MWLSRRFGGVQQTAAEKGMVSVGGNAVLKTVSTVQSEEVQNYAPYGYSAYAPDGEEILIINSTGGAAGAGTRMKQDLLQAGEISITSAGGAKITLKNNGDIELNGLAVTLKGEIKNSEGEIVL